MRRHLDVEIGLGRVRQARHRPCSAPPAMFRSSHILLEGAFARQIRDEHRAPVTSEERP